jgi:hypothetical protein
MCLELDLQIPKIYGKYMNNLSMCLFGTSQSLDVVPWENTILIHRGFHLVGLFLTFYNFGKSLTVINKFRH